MPTAIVTTPVTPESRCRLRRLRDRGIQTIAAAAANSSKDTKGAVRRYSSYAPSAAVSLVL